MALTYILEELVRTTTKLLSGENSVTIGYDNSSRIKTIQVVKTERF